MAGALVLALDTSDATVGHAHAQFGISVLALLFGVWTFWTHGRRQVTAAGVYGIGSAVFVGFAGLYWWNDRGRLLPGTLFAATAVCYFTHVGMYFLFWHRQGRGFKDLPWHPAERDVSNGGVLLGAVVTLCGVAAASRGALISLSGPTAFAGIALMTVSLCRQTNLRALSPLRILLIGAAFALYARYVFTGYGRLNLAALGLMVAIVVARQVPGRTVKLVGLLGVGPALWVFIQLRESFGRSLYGGSGLSGIGSVVSPLRFFARLIDLQASLPLGNGDTFLAALVTPVPSALWADKPPGFGAVLAQIFNPQVLGVGGSLAALAHGEWFYDFRWWGVVAMVAVLGLAVGWTDRWLLAASSRPIVHRWQLLSLTGAVLASAGVVDLLWVGSQTYMARTGVRVLVLLLLLVTWGAFFRRERGRRPSTRARDAAP
ncbi:hypothetical protein ACPPVT_02815 [Angustibacter sp. McL0619]|uniref:hypothetical protein n=1 Tax=Angustibacter sp. McL0619 TaxID=3415676 RepID=UPI003CE719D1